MMLTKDELKKYAYPIYATDKVISEIARTAIALYEAIDLANLEIKHAYNDNEAHRQRIVELESNNLMELKTEETHPTFYHTIINSKEWKAWTAYQESLEMMEWDLPECRECGWLSPEHWKAFIGFVRHEPPVYRNEK